MTARRHAARHFLDWQHPVDGSRVRIRVTHTRNYLIEGTDHIEIESITPAKAPLPITETGYVSHFIDARELMAAGGPKSYAEGWLARESRSKEWLKKDAARRQGDLFQWADANAETGRRAQQKAKPSRASRPKRSAPKRRRKDRAPE